MLLLCSVKVLRNQKLYHTARGPLLMLERILPFGEAFVAIDCPVQMGREFGFTPAEEPFTYRGQSGDSF
jgi:hypothetical protein